MMKRVCLCSVYVSFLLVLSVERAGGLTLCMELANWQSQADGVVVGVGEVLGGGESQRPDPCLAV